MSGAALSGVHAVKGEYRDTGSSSPKAELITSVHLCEDFKVSAPQSLSNAWGCLARLQPRWVAARPDCLDKGVSVEAGTRWSALSEKETDPE